MIVKTDFTRGDGLARHLARTDTNIRVLIREDLSQGVPLDLALAVPFLGGFAATNPRAVRRVIHVKCSPRAEHEGAPMLVLKLVCERYGISPTAPRICVQHKKPQADGTPRPDHFHFVLPLVDLETGKAVRSHDAPLKDEIISRIAEIELGEAVTPGVRHKEVVSRLGDEEEVAIADELARYDPARPGERMTTGTRRSLQRAGLDADDVGARLLDAWCRASGDVATFVAQARQAGFEMTAGESVILAVHIESRVPIPLRRTLNQASKTAGAALRLRRESCDELFRDMPEHRSRQKIRDTRKLAVDRIETDEQLLRLGREALADGDGKRAARAFGAVAFRRLRWETEQASERRAIVQARRDEQRRAEIVGQRRVERAFRHAGMFADRRLRRMVVAAVAAGAMLAGGGLGAVLLAGGIALAALPSYEKARAIQFIERRDRLARYQRERCELQQHRADAGVVQETWAKALTGRLDHRLAGAYFDLLAIERRRTLRFEERKRKGALRAALRKAKADMLDELGRRAGAAAIGKALGFQSMRTDRDRRAVAEALRDRRQIEVADTLDPTYAWIRDYAMSRATSVTLGIEADDLERPIAASENTVAPQAGAADGVKAAQAGVAVRNTRGAVMRLPVISRRGRGIGD